MFIKLSKLSIFIFAIFYLTQGLAASPIVGRYWAFAPCSQLPPQRNHPDYESRGHNHTMPFEVYDKHTHRGELASNVTILLSNAVNKKLCVKSVSKDIAINTPTWYFLMPKPTAMISLKNKRIKFSVLREISIFPSKDGTYCSSLIVHKESKILNLADLSMKTILIPSYNSISSYLYPIRFLHSYINTEHIHFKVLKKNESKVKLVNDFMSSNSRNALLVWRPMLNPYQGKYRTLLSFCGIPDYILIANDKIVSREQVIKVNKALDNYHGTFISWVKPNLKAINRFLSFISN